MELPIARATLALILTPMAQWPLIGWELVSSRIVTAKFIIKNNINRHVTQCCAPTNDTEEETKDDFYTNNYWLC
jgi:hypothetical protein